MTALERACVKLGISARAEYGKNKKPHGDPSWPCHPWRVTLYKGGTRSLTVDFFQGMAHEREPSAADVLSCLVTDARCGDQSFEDFCSDLGEDPDSRKSHATWKACARMAPKLRRFLGADFEEVCNAEH